MYPRNINTTPTTPTSPFRFTQISAISTLLAHPYDGLDLAISISYGPVRSASRKSKIVRLGSIRRHNRIDPNRTYEGNPCGSYVPGNSLKLVSRAFHDSDSEPRFFRRGNSHGYVRFSISLLIPFCVQVGSVPCLASAKSYH